MSNNEIVLKLFNDKGFIELANKNHQINDFNIFEVIQVAQYEIRHSNVIAWLFNPKERHNLNNLFIKSFFERLHKFPKNKNKLVELKKNNIDLMELDFDANDLVVERERKYMDIFIKSSKGKLIESMLLPSHSFFNFQVIVFYYKYKYKLIVF